MEAGKHLSMWSFGNGKCGISRRSTPDNVFYLRVGTVGVTMIRKWKVHILPTSRQTHSEDRYSQLSRPNERRRPCPFNAGTAETRNCSSESECPLSLLHPPAEWSTACVFPYRIRSIAQPREARAAGRVTTRVLLRYVRPVLCRCQSGA